MAAASDNPARGGKVGASATQPTQRPRDAAVLVIVDTTGAEPRLLMGRRRATQVFMPNKIVFPGGRVDAADRNIECASELAACELAKLLLQMKGHASEARGRSMALAAIRETYEETGVLIGRPAPDASSDLPGWAAFMQHGFRPALSDLCFFARAITPPGPPRRYDTRFFCVSADAIAGEFDPPDDELRDVSWYGIEAIASLELPPITKVILADLQDRLAAGPLGPMAVPVPFYHQRHGTFRRELLSVGKVE